MQDTYHNNNKNIACLKNCKVWMFLHLRFPIYSNLQVTYRYNDKNIHIFQTCNVIVHSILQNGLQATYHYDHKNNQCLPKLTNIHSSYRYNDKQTDTLTSYRMSQSV